MASRDIKSFRDDYPEKSDRDAAATLSRQYGYMAVVRYKNSKTASDFTNIGTCTSESEIRGYLSSPYCYGAEILYDVRSVLFPIDANHVLNGKCERCGKNTTAQTLQLHAGNDFYFCPKCGFLFCDDCYTRLPLTGSPGYGKCPTCDTQVKRAIPSFFITQAGTGSPSPDASKRAAQISPVGTTRRWWEFWKGSAQRGA